jgi:hypothetical protein
VAPREFAIVHITFREIAMASPSLARLPVFLLAVLLVMLPLAAQAQTAAPAAGGTGSQDGIYCRPPQPRNDSRLPGPQICKPISEWNRLRAAGYDVDANGVVKPLQGLKDLNNLSH